MAFRRSFVATLFVSVAGCVAAPPQPKPTPPVVTPTPRPTPTPTPVPTYSSWMDVPQTPGDWRYETSAQGSAAVFGTTPSGTLFRVSCNPRTHFIGFARTGSFANTAAFTVRTESATRTLPIPPIGDTSALIASLNATDPLLDAMAFTKGRFAIEATGAPTLYLPSWPEVTRVIEDCR